MTWARNKAQCRLTTGRWYNTELARKLFNSVDGILLCREATSLSKHPDFQDGSHSSPVILMQGTQLPSLGLWCPQQGGWDQPEESTVLRKGQKAGKRLTQSSVCPLKRHPHPTRNLSLQTLDRITLEPHRPPEQSRCPLPYTQLGKQSQPCLSRDIHVPWPYLEIISFN